MTGNIWKIHRFRSNRLPFSVDTPCFDKGRLQDYVEAAKWFRKAAENGWREGKIRAQYNLGVMYLNGEGVQKNYVEAYAWFLLATKANGDEEVSEMISIFEKDFTVEQMERGQERAAELHCLQEQNSENDFPILVDWVGLWRSMNGFINEFDFVLEKVARNA